MSRKFSKYFWQHSLWYSVISANLHSHLTHISREADKISDLSLLVCKVFKSLFLYPIIKSNLAATSPHLGKLEGLPAYNVSTRRVGITWGLPVATVVWLANRSLWISLTEACRAIKSSRTRGTDAWCQFHRLFSVRVCVREQQTEKREMLCVTA